MGDPRPIGFFDSGVGGLTVLVEVMRRLPGEDTVYLGDNARTPYGPRPDDEVLRFSTECLDVLAERDVKAIVVACNTSTAIALPDLRRRYALPILGVVRPGATAAALATRTRAVGVIATQATVRSHAYFEAIKEEDPFVEVYEHATPDLVPLVEAGRLAGPDVEADGAPLPGAAPGLGSGGRCRPLTAPSSFPCPGAPASTRCCWAAPTIRCSAPSSAASSAMTSPSSTPRPPRPAPSPASSRSMPSVRLAGSRVAT